MTLVNNNNNLFEVPHPIRAGHNFVCKMRKMSSFERERANSRPHFTRVNVISYNLSCHF